MNIGPIYSDQTSPTEWSETEHLRLAFGPKAAGLAALPREWTPAYAIVPATFFVSPDNAVIEQILKSDLVLMNRIGLIAALTGKIYVRSSIIEETIWDRGTYESVIVEWTTSGFEQALAGAVGQVLASAVGRSVGLVFQSFVQPRAQGEFGNLLRVSKTRDHWELDSDAAGAVTRVRFNSQRDEAANPQMPLEIKGGISRERMFGSIAAWLNNHLLRGRAQRINCEWIADHDRLYIVQIDEETEDYIGINPFQVRVEPIHQPSAAHGAYFSHAQEDSLREWDKLSVLDELWEPAATHKPTLFFAPVSVIPASDDQSAITRLEEDFQRLIGPDRIVVRTSVRAGREKIPNLKRTEGLSPSEAARWCINVRDELTQGTRSLEDFAFVAHRFIAARASAWVRSEPGNPVVEIHSLWGLPDALQYCPYDIWEIHLPTDVATEFPDFKSHMLTAREDGGWEYVRIKNEYGRSLSIGRRDAMDLAQRTFAISTRIGRPCHVMWFVGCADGNGVSFNLPWYWTEAHDTGANIDRTNFTVASVANEFDLAAFCSSSGSKLRFALELRPEDQDLMRDMKFIGRVGAAAKQFGVPVILAGSTLAHAYFELTRQGCMVVSSTGRDHSRLRKITSFGKIVRDKIPARIAQRGEIESTKRVPEQLKKGFLVSKLLEEAIEVRGAETIEAKRVELADLLEVVRALANAENVPFQDVIAAADEKRGKSGGFDEGLVLLQTGLIGRSRGSTQENKTNSTQVLARKISDTTYELPFTFFGFMELDQARSLDFREAGVRLLLTLKGDRIQLEISRVAEQLLLPLDMTFEEGGETANPITLLDP